jgi:DNA-binding transcriptional regulator YhcF (GntR family)
VFFKPNPSSSAPIYVQLMEQVRHAVEVGALKAGDQLPGIRHLAETLVINPNTVAKAYRELEHEGTIELRHGSGAFVRDTHCGQKVQTAAPLVTALVEKLKSRGLNESEIRRLFESALMRKEEPVRTR